jgi:NAD/NADP transhydrogenase beta subunit
MMMMQQALPANTNTTTITQRALSYVQNQEIQPSNSSVVIILIAIIGAILIIGSVIAFRKLKA